MRVALSLTMDPQSAVGGWMPRPRNDRALMVRKTKQKRRPNSAISGGRMFGRISRVMIQPSFSPCSLAASTKSSTTTRSEEHTSELQSHVNLVCRLLLEKKKKKKK